MVFTTSPRKVSTLGLICARASQRTMASSSTPQPRPKALVQVMLMEASSLGFRLVVNGSQVKNFHLAIAIGSDHDRAVSHFLIQQGAADWRTGRNLARGYIRLFAGHQLVLDLRILGAVIDPHR